jgi:hypothetical protein
MMSSHDAASRAQMIFDRPAIAGLPASEYH